MILFENNLEFLHSFLLCSLNFISLTVFTSHYTLAGFLGNLHIPPLNRVTFGPGCFIFTYFMALSYDRWLGAHEWSFYLYLCVVERVMFVEVAKSETVRRTKNDKWKFKEHVIK